MNNSIYNHFYYYDKPIKLSKIRERPDWDDVFMSMAFVIAMRSPDPHTAHGAVIVDQQNHIKSIGFNGFPPGCDDRYMPTERPLKYKLMEHAERNAINNATCQLNECTVYVTGYPCADCFRTMRCNGISKIVYGPIGSKMLSDEDLKAIELMNRDHLAPKMRYETYVEIVKYQGNHELCMDLAKAYYKSKMEAQGE